MDTNEVNSFLPYFLRAAYDWLVDNKLEVYIEVTANYPGVNVPKKYVENDKIILDVSPQAVRNLKIDNTALEFDARFGSIFYHIFSPIAAIIAIYDPRSEYGINFIPTLSLMLPASAITITAKEKNTKPLGTTKPKLTLIKKHRPPQDTK